MKNLTLNLNGAKFTAPDIAHGYEHKTVKEVQMAHQHSTALLEKSEPAKLRFARSVAAVNPLSQLEKGQRKKVFSAPLKDLPDLKGASVAILYLVSKQFISTEMITAEVDGQMSRTTVFAHLTDHVANGYLTFTTVPKSVGAPSRVFELTPAGDRQIEIYMEFCQSKR